MNTTLRLRRYFLTLTALLLGLAGPVFGQQGPGLDLATRPLFAGANVPPNVLVAVDDSGSMDFETLFPTNSGVLYWDPDLQSTWTGTGFVSSGGYGYVYLFPNGFNNLGYNDRRVYYNYFAVPPIRQMAFTRSPAYNQAYFNPSVTYDPWVDKENINWERAPADPIDGSDTFDLTRVRDADGYGEMFLMLPGMTVPGGTVYKECTEYYLDFFCTKQTSWKTADNDFVISYAQKMSIKYFVATFYLSADASLPVGYGYTAPALTAKAPDGRTLQGYEIKRDNFSSDQKYEAAIQNFANWFTYYRKRHLATRGGIAAAFDQIGDLRVGSCTINTREPLTMRDLDIASEREAFYKEIFEIDFSQARGTPNRKGLQFLGEQLENNDDIISSPCQRNFAILFTDGFNTGDVLQSVGNIDGNYGPPFADGYSDTIADVAMHYYKNLDTPDWPDGELRIPSECDDPQPPLSLDCEADLHMVTFGVTLGQSGLIYNTPLQPADPYTDPPTWPNPRTGPNYGIEQIDDLWHATVNTRGELLNATTPTEIADAFVSALEDILAQQGSASSVAVNSASLTVNSTAYQASFIASSWSGLLKALPQTDTTDTGFGPPLWEASEQLQTIAWEDRVILTSEPDACGDNDPVAFRSSEDCDLLSSEEVAYIRGDQSNERANDGEFRNRGDNILGDIIHSSPLYVGAPQRVFYPREWKDLRHPNNDMPENGVKDYSNPQGQSFAQGAAAERTPMVYVGANDGMLHGFHAETGEELIAYIPSTLIDDLDELTEPNYIHRYYVDGSPVSGDVVFDDAWHTVLVSGLRGGGKSVFALDITNPDNFSEDNPEDTVLWEFEHDELGYTYGQPSIVRLHNGKWAAIFGNGYNSCSESAQLFIVNIETGGLIKHIDTGAGPDRKNKGGDDDDDDDEDSDGGNDCGRGDGDGDDDDGDDENDEGDDDDNDNKDNCDTEKHRDHKHCKASNGLGEVFPVDLDGDFVTDYVYAGDLYGNLWKFDLTDDDEDKWKVGMNGEPLFVACADPANCDETRQPITAQPQVGAHPYGLDYGVMVYFGTGKYLESSDRRADPDATPNSFYGIWDLDVFTFNEAVNGEPLFEAYEKSEIPRGRLVEQELLPLVDGGNTSYRLVTDNAVPYQTEDNDSNGKRGWYIDFPAGQGEMIVSDARIDDTSERPTISFSTTIPNKESCKAGGSGFFMLLDAETGGRTDFPAFDLNGDFDFTVDEDTFDHGGEQVGASGMMLDAGVPGEATHQIDHRGDQAYYIIPASDGTIRRVFTPKQPDIRRSWREIRR